VTEQEKPDVDPSSSRSLTGSLRYANKKPPSKYPEGRVCAWATCETVLSVYNIGPGCARHYKLNPRPRIRGQRR
jgi:hypothetical protein